MTDEIRITNPVRVHADLSHFDNHAAIPASEPLHALYQEPADPKHPKARTVHGFTAGGHPLVFDEDHTRLVDAQKLSRPEHEFVRVQRANPPLTGPFTPAPAGLVARFQDGHTEPVVFYDIHGRAVLLGNDQHPRLHLAKDAAGLVAIQDRT